MCAALDFYNTTNLLYGSITEYCTPTECPQMSAGSQYEYLWADGVIVKKPVRVSAPEYVDLLMNWIEGFINDEKVFPSTPGMW
jgi:MOB kinase activator 1